MSDVPNRFEPRGDFLLKEVVVRARVLAHEQVPEAVVHVEVLVAELDLAVVIHLCSWLEGTQICVFESVEVQQLVRVVSLNRLAGSELWQGQNVLV